MPRPAARGEVLEAVAALAEAHPERAVFIGIDGFGAAGKSTLADAVATSLPRGAIVRVDDFTSPAFPEWDWDRFGRQVVAPLSAGTGARYEVSHWRDGQTGQWREIAPRPVLVVEGVSCTRREAAVPWDLIVWVEAPRYVRLQRLAARDGAAMMLRWHEHWLPSETAYAQRERPETRADLVVSGMDGSCPD